MIGRAEFDLGKNITEAKGIKMAVARIREEEDG